MTSEQRERIEAQANNDCHRDGEIGNYGRAVAALLSAHDALHAQLAEARAEVEGLTEERDVAKAQSVANATALARYALDREAAEESSRFHQERARQAEEEVERLRAQLDRVAPHICPECGPHARVDEDGCCAACGADTHFASDPYAPPRGAATGDDDGR